MFRAALHRPILNGVLAVLCVAVVTMAAAGRGESRADAHPAQPTAASVRAEPAVIGMGWG